MLSSFLTFALASSALALPAPGRDFQGYRPDDTPKSAYDKSLGLIVFRNSPNYNSTDAHLVGRDRFRLEEWEPEKILNKRLSIEAKKGDYVLIHPKRNCYAELRKKDFNIDKVLEPSYQAYHMDEDQYLALTCPDHDPVALLRKDKETIFWNRKLFNKGTYHEEKADGNYQIFMMNPSCKGYINNNAFTKTSDKGSSLGEASAGDMVKVDCSPSSGQSSSSSNSEKIISTDQGEQETGKPSDYQDKEVKFKNGGKINYIKDGCKAYRVKDNSPLSADLNDSSKSGINPWEGFKVKC